MIYWFRVPSFAIVILLSATTLWADGYPRPKTHYSADTRVSTSQGGQKHEFTGRTYYGGDRHRHEWNAPGGEGSQAVIVCEDKGVSWVLIPQQKQYLENRLDDGKDDDEKGYFEPSKVGKGDFKMTQVGSETVNGVKCAKYKFTSTGDGETSTGFLWLSGDSIMVKMTGSEQGRHGKSEFQYELLNLKTGKQKPALFEIPKGYTRFQMPSFGGGMPSGARPGGPGKPPSQAEADAMKKQMEEMMKKMQEQMGGGR